MFTGSARWGASHTNVSTTKENVCHWVHVEYGIYKGKKPKRIKFNAEQNTSPRKRVYCMGITGSQAQHDFERAVIMHEAAAQVAASRRKFGDEREVPLQQVVLVGE